MAWLCANNVKTLTIDDLHSQKLRPEERTICLTFDDGWLGNYLHGYPILKEYEFITLRKDVYTNEEDLAVILLEMEVSKLPSVDKRIGPMVFDLDDSERFLKKYKNNCLVGPFIENNYWCAEVKRKFLTAREKLLDILSYTLTVLKEKGIPNYIAKQIVKKFEIIYESSKMMELIKKDNNFGIFLRRYFEKESLVD